jgi:hypothetical protein
MLHTGMVHLSRFHQKRNRNAAAIISPAGTLWESVTIDEG